MTETVREPHLLYIFRPYLDSNELARHAVDLSRLGGGSALNVVSGPPTGRTTGGETNRNLTRLMTPRDRRIYPKKHSRSN